MIGGQKNPGKENFVKRRFITVLATAATAAGTVLVVAPSASASDEVIPSTGVVTSWPAGGTGGLILRDERGNDLGSGIGEGQDFEFVECGPAGSGLIRVNQLTRGEGGGWGPLYEGYVKIEWTMRPSQFGACE